MNKTMEFDIITDEKLEDISNLLKTHAANWATSLASKISTSKPWKNSYSKDCSTQTVYNLSTGRIKSQFKRRIFAKCAAELLMAEAQTSVVVSDVVDSIIENNKS